MNGFVLIDKPAGISSHDVVNRWRKLSGEKRAGHLGTLDPLATGLLVLMAGRATRLAQYFGDNEKRYLAEITFGVVSDTYDADGVITETGGAVLCDVAQIHRALEKFRGRFLQTPPAVSAKKVGGVAAYKLARKQISVDLKAIEVEVKELELRSAGQGKLELLVTCSAGTYIRSLAHDLGQELGCGALLSRLRRLQSGEFSVEQARTLEQLTELAGSDRLCEALLPSASLLSRFPAEYFDVGMEAQIRQGRDFRTSPFVVPPGTPFVKALSHSGELIAIGELRVPNLYHPATVL